MKALSSRKRFIERQGAYTVGDLVAEAARLRWRDFVSWFGILSLNLSSLPCDKGG